MEFKADHHRSRRTQSAVATFGVTVAEDGGIETLRSGAFDAGLADEIARQLVLLAASIRAKARQRLFDADQ